MALLAGALSPAPGPRDADPWVVFVSGDLGGYLTPCGCTKPMAGGIRRRADAIRSLAPAERRVVLDNGGVATDLTRQNELKAETLAEALRAMNVGAVNLAPSEARLGPGAVASMARLSGGRLICTVLEPSSRLELATNRAAGPFLVGGAAARPEQIAGPLDERARPLDEAVRGLIADARERGRPAILLFQGNREEATALARRVPGLALVVFSSRSAPGAQMERVGPTTLVTPGEQGRHVLRLEWDGRRFSRYAAINLGEEYKDDPAVARIYAEYQRRVDREGLLDQVARRPSEGFVGNRACGSCHANAAAVWRKSPHAGALKTLEDDGHGRDPDCVGCHVVGLDREGGFRSRLKTPELTDVGCESCHGPGARHSAEPIRVKMGKVGETPCRSCHTPNTSPKFDYAAYWERIRHGR